MESVIPPLAEANGSIMWKGGDEVDLDGKPVPPEDVLNGSCLSECPSFDSTPCTSPRKGDNLAPFLATQSKAVPETPNIFTVPVVRLVGAPLAAGQPLEGVQRGPEALREAGLKECVRSLRWQFEDHGDVSIAPCGPVEPSTAPALGKSPPPQNYQQLYYSRKKIKNCSYIGKACGQIFEACREGALQKRFVLNVGGDHSIATGTISAMLSVYPNLAVVWVDAHGDCNTPETSPSANYHGMPVAHLLGWFTKKAKGFGWREKNHPMASSGSSSNGDMGKPQAAVANGGPTYYRLDEEHLVFIGLRDIDPDEGRLLTNSRVKTFTMTDLDRLGIGQVMERALKCIDPDGDRPLYLSFDIDSCDPGIAPGTGTKARGGLTYREAHYIAEVLAQTRRLVGMDLVEINPAMDKKLQSTQKSGAVGGGASVVHADSTGAPPHEEDGEMHGDQLPLAKGTTPTVRLGIELAASALGNTIL